MKSIENYFTINDNKINDFQIISIRLCYDLRFILYCYNSREGINLQLSISPSSYRTERQNFTHLT